MITCPSCGTQSPPDTQFCGNCGKPLQQPKVTTPIHSTGQTTPLSQTSTTKKPVVGATTKLDAPGFGALPAGALLKQRRYEIFLLQNESLQHNIYLAYDRHTRICPACNFPTDGSINKFCEYCGASLPESASEPPLFRLWESSDAAALASKTKLASLKLRHPGLLSVYDAFSQSEEGDPERHYAVVDQDLGQSLTALLDPPSTQNVLLWTKQLAETLAYLHEQKYYYPTLNLNQMRVVGGRAKLSNLDQIQPLPKGGESAAIAQNLNTLLQALVGLIATQPLPTLLTPLLERAQSNSYATGKALATEIDAVVVELTRLANLTWQTGRLSDLGKVREINEDSLLTLELARVHDSKSRPLALFAVADGMGGHEGGEIASALAIGALAQFMTEKVMQPVSGQPALPPLDFASLLKEGCQTAAQIVHAEASRRSTDMGTTLVTALLVGSDLYVANVGDSRAYRITHAKIEQISVDHTLVELLVSKQQLTREQAQNHPQANLIYRSLGEKANVEVDLYRQQIVPGEWLLLCSDGLSGYVDDQQIHRIITASAYPQLACHKLIEQANAAGGYDNITAIVVKVE